MSDVNDLKAELLVLKAENAELRKERDFYFQQATENGERAHGAIDALQAENANLRELVRDTIPYVDCHLGSDECIHLHECHGGNGCVFERLAHELGVEV